LALYRKQAWAEAVKAFGAALEAMPDDGPSKVFLRRVARLEAEPPPADWNGGWALGDK